MSKSRRANTFRGARKRNGSSGVTNNSADASSVKQKETKEMGEKNKRENERRRALTNPLLYIYLYTQYIIILKIRYNIRAEAEIQRVK